MMYPGNQYYTQQNLNRSQVPNTSTYFQQHPSRYQSMQSNVIQTTTPTQSANFQTSQIHNASRLLSKQTASRPASSSQNFSMQNLSWLPNGSPVVRPVQQSHIQANNQWPRTLIERDRGSFGAIGSNQSSLVGHQQNLSNQGLDFRAALTRPGNRIQSSQFSTVAQPSKVLPPMSQRTSTINSNLNMYSSDRLLTSNQALQRANSSNNNRIQDPGNLLHSLASTSNTRMTSLSGSLPQQFNLNSLSAHHSKKLPQQQQQTEKRDKIHIRFDQKTKQLPKPLPRNTMAQNLSRDSDSDSSVKDGDDSQAKAKTPIVLESNTRIVIDDDLEIVGTKQAEILFHSRSDCPIHPYIRIEKVDIPPNSSNLKCCSKCFCFICDKLAEQCKNWNQSYSPHCNANAKSSCWKARRNIKKSQLMNLLTAEETTSEINQAGEIASGHTIRVREAYIDYRMGVACEFHLVPCECACHHSNKLSKEVCAQCKAVHDARKKFNYEPVRQVILKILQEIQKDFKGKPYSALILYEALLSELCSHRPADFNHVTRMPSNPDARCQCNTPQIMDEYLDMDLIKIFTLHEVQPSFKEKFMKCVNASLQPLQLKDIMKRFLQMRHWDDPLLRSVLLGQVSLKHVADALKEQPLIIEMRRTKLTQENNYACLLHYLKHVKVAKVPTAKNCSSDGTPILVAIERWLLECLAKMGYFREACLQLATLIRKLPFDFIMNIFSLLTGKGLPPGTNMIYSFNQRMNTTGYTVKEMDKTVLLLVYLMFMEVNITAQANFSCYLWLAKWLNEEKIVHEPDKAMHWIQGSTKLLDWSRRVFTLPNYQQHFQQCQVITPQTALFTCSSLIIQYLKKQPSNMSCIQDVIDAYKPNDWALFYMFSQPALLSSGSHPLIAWMTNFMKRTGNNLTQFSPEAFKLLISRNSFEDISLFMQQWIAPAWVNQPSDMYPYFLEMFALFARRILDAINQKQNVQNLDWFPEVVLKVIFDNKLEFNHPLSRQYYEMIESTCSYMSVKNVAYTKRLRKDLSPLLAFHEDRFSRNELNAQEIVELVRLAVETNNSTVLNTIFSHYIETHECPEPTAAAYLIMEEIISILTSPQQPLTKKEMITILYSKLCAHEALSWLICAKCSGNMPVKWMEVWNALAENGLKSKIGQMVEQTLQLFVMWIRSLSALEEKDMKRLLFCLESFFNNMAKTVIEHGVFELTVLQETLINTSNYFSSQTLQCDFREIIQRIFDALRSSQAPVASQFFKSEEVDTTAENHRTIPPAPQATSSATSVQTPSVPNSPSNKQSVQSPPVTSHKPLKLTISKSRLSTSSSNGKVTPVSEKNIMSPSPIGSPAAVCPQCGDSMTSSLRCSKCHTRKTIDVRCPSCNQINSDVKGYSCRYCYASLLEVLTSGGEPVAPEPPPPPKPEPEKKRKKLKRKRSEQVLNVTESLPKPMEMVRSKPSAEEKKMEEKSLPPTPKTLLQKTKDLKTVEEKSIPLTPKTLIQKNKDFNLKSTSIPSMSKSSHKNVISKISVDDLTPQPPKPHQRAKEAQRKERPTTKLSIPVKRAHIVNTNVKMTPNLSDSDSDSASDTVEHVPALILRRKPEVEAPVPERKSIPGESSHSTKRVTNQGNSMSKKQRNILQRMKNVGRVKQIPKQSKKTTKSSATSIPEWEVQKRRKPGPKSKTSYYTIHPSWDIPRRHEAR